MGTYNPNEVGNRVVFFFFISEFLYLIGKGPKTILVIGPETRSAVSWSRYCVIQHILERWSLRFWRLMDLPVLNWFRFNSLICVIRGSSEVMELQPFLTFPQHEQFLNSFIFIHSLSPLLLFPLQFVHSSPNASEGD